MKPRLLRCKHVSHYGHYVRCTGWYRHEVWLDTAHTFDPQRPGPMPVHLASRRVNLWIWVAILTGVYLALAATAGGAFDGK